MITKRELKALEDRLRIWQYWIQKERQRAVLKKNAEVHPISQLEALPPQVPELSAVHQNYQYFVEDYYGYTGLDLERVAVNELD